MNTEHLTILVSIEISNERFFFVLPTQIFHRDVVVMRSEVLFIYLNESFFAVLNRKLTR